MASWRTRRDGSTANAHISAGWSEHARLLAGAFVPLVAVVMTAQISSAYDTPILIAIAALLAVNVARVLRRNHGGQ